MRIQDHVAVITGAASGIGRATSAELARRGVRAIALVDRDEQVNQVRLCPPAQDKCGVKVRRYAGDVADPAFRRRVFDEMTAEFGPPRICVPAAGITRDALAVKIDKESGKSAIYPLETFRQVLEINLIAPVYWALEMVGRIAEDRFARGLKRWTPDEDMQGTVIFIGSVSSLGNKGQLAYAATKAGLEGAAATLAQEAVFHGVRCGVIHPGFTDTPMVRSLGEDYINQRILPQTQLHRLIRPEEIADAICFMIGNSAVSGQLWADAGWRPAPA